ncbi:IS5 family transposase [Patescibacteria group bacterium]|nr:IS5 family transposase [Patescibacteria group bacterium]
MQTSKSPKQTARVAYLAAKEALPPYSHQCSPHKFTQPQLVACLVLKEFFATDYRGITAILEDSSDLRKVLGLKTVPHYTTLQKAAARLLKKKIMRKLIAGILTIAAQEKLIKPKVQLAALDSTGFESHHVSHYFVKRRSKNDPLQYQQTTYARYPKLGLVCDCANHLILSGVTGQGPGPDITHYQEALSEASQQRPLDTLLADAGYDSEASHSLVRTKYHTKTIIPARIGRPTTKLPLTHYRRQMATNFDRQTYGQRWQVETVMSMLKRNFGAALKARSYWSQSREMMLRVFSHNVMIVLPVF